jgi:hypothetical protein
VTLAGGAAHVGPRPEGSHDADVDVAVEGPLVALAPLGAGGAGWRLKGATISGSRRKLRRVVKARRNPVGLADLAAAGVAIHPGLLLSALATAVEPAWTAGHRFAVAYDIDGDGAYTVLAADGQPLLLTERDPAELPGTPSPAPAAVLGDPTAPAATVHATAGAILPVLRGAEPPAGERAVVIGDRRVVEVLHAWFDRARGVRTG